MQRIHVGDTPRVHRHRTGGGGPVRGTHTHQTMIPNNSAVARLLPPVPHASSRQADTQGGRAADCRGPFQLNTMVGSRGPPLIRLACFTQ